uniref:POT1PC domain-containing protein n=1 Tax=Caenorhabditis japonica TaxID=281687 RepID=A0A8R1EII4_CAEJA
MTSTWDTTLKKRVERAARFDDNTFYINYLRYFDVLGQLHSVAETKYGTWMLRLWRATQFGPEKYERCREEGMFRVRQDYFHRYIIPPDPHIAKAINVYGYNHLMEIEIYDEHRDYLEALRSGEYITVTNVHYSKGKVGDSLKLHGGSLYNRGIFKVPDDCSDHRFLEVKRRIENALDQITDYQDFVEFTEVSYPNAMPIQTPSASSSSKSSSSANFFSPPTFPTKRKWKSFRAATENGKTAIAKPCQKIIIGDLIAVDWFGYENERCVPPGIIHPLEEDIPHQFEEFTVTLISANHCPGSVMFVFEGPAVPGERVLCTGDFRADKNLMKQLEPEEPLHWLTEKKFDTIYIDNTYFSLHLPFPDRVTAFNELTRGISQHPDKNIYIPLQRLGREEMIEDLSRAIMEPIFAYTEKKSFSCAMSYFFEFGIRNPTRTIRIVKRNKWQ